MSKYFNVTATCVPWKHYMVDITDRLRQIKVMVDRGDYFTINRARQYGKTTMLAALEHYLQEDYRVISLDFQSLSTGDFKDSCSFSRALAREFYLSATMLNGISDNILSQLKEFAFGKASDLELSELFLFINIWCGQSDRPLVLIIDEVDAASNNQVFLDFLAQLRAAYIKHGKYQYAAFQSVILAGVYTGQKYLSKKTAGGISCCICDRLSMGREIIISNHVPEIRNVRM